MLLWQLAAAAAAAAAAEWYVDQYLHSGYQPSCHTLANSDSDNLHTTGLNKGMPKYGAFLKELISYS